MDERREKIIEVSKKLFSENGFAGTGLRAIAQEAGVSIGNIYNYFKNKEEIFKTILDPTNIFKVYYEVAEIINKDFPLNLDKVILHTKKVVDNNIELYTLIFIDIVEFGGERTNSILQTAIDFGKSTFAQNVKDPKANFVLRDLDYNFYVKIYVTSILSFFIMSTILPSADIYNYSDEEVSKMISDVLLHGIMKKAD